MGQKGATTLERKGGILTGNLTKTIAYVLFTHDGYCVQQADVHSQHGCTINQIFCSLIVMDK